MAAEEITRRIAASPEPNSLLFFCRAQVLARLGEWAGAGIDLDEYSRRTIDASAWHHEAFLLRGFLR